MAAVAITRIQLCGQFAVVADGHRIDAELPGRRGRLLVAYLAATREQPTTREQLIEALWPEGSTDANSATLTVLLSKSRALLGHHLIRGRRSLQLALPAETIVDIDIAAMMLHRAESAIALRDWRRAWATVLGALFTTRRRFLSEFDAPWIEDQRDRFHLMQERALACYTQACLGIGGTELPAAERSARQLVHIAPLSETGYQLLMQAQAAKGDIASALQTYEQLRHRVADELGVDPSPRSRAIHHDLLTSGG